MMITNMAKAVMLVHGDFQVVIPINKKKEFMELHREYQKDMGRIPPLIMAETDQEIYIRKGDW